MDKAEIQAKEELSSPWERNVIYQGKIITLRHDKLERPGKTSIKWDAVMHPGSVVLIAITNENKIILVKQWRRVVGEILYELPAGTVERGESPLECATREIQEETGYKAGKLTPKGGFFASPGYCDEYFHIFLAENLSKNSLPQDEDEAIEVIEITIDKALEMIDDHSICDSKTIAAIYLYLRMKK